MFQIAHARPRTHARCLCRVFLYVNTNRWSTKEINYFWDAPLCGLVAIYRYYGYMFGLGVQGEGRRSAFLRKVSKFIPGDTESHRLEPQIWNVSAGLLKSNQNIKTAYLPLRIKVMYLSQEYVGTRTRLMVRSLEQGSYLWRKPCWKTE